jgi:hypothetical protein
VLLLHVRSLGYANAAVLVGILFSLLSAGAAGRRSRVGEAGRRRGVMRPPSWRRHWGWRCSRSSAAWALMGGILCWASAWASR